MALNITFAGSITDSNDNLIDAKLQIFVKNKNNSLTKWSDVFETEDTDYNKNLGDPDISGQENTLGLSDSNGEFVIIAVWKDGERNVNNIPTEFAYIVHELKGDELYVQDIKLSAPNAITCENWEVPSEIIQGNPIVALNHNTNESTYQAKDITHFLYKKFENEIIFPFMGTKEALFNFNDEGYSASNVYNPEEGGDCLIKIKVQDYFDTEVECQKITKVFYKVSCCFNDLTSPYRVQDEIQISACNSGHTDKIVNIKYKIYDEIIESASFIKTLTVFGDIEITQYTTYFNAYENIEIECSRIIPMENIPPEVNLVVIKEPQSDMAKKDYEFAHNGTDVDGYIEKVEWQIHRNNPDINGNESWNLYYTTGTITDLSDWFYNIDDIIGDLKVVAIVYDNLGASAQDEFLIANDCSDIALSFDNIDWSKKIKTIDFNTKINKISWENKKIKKEWTMKTIPISWENKPKKIQWIQVKKGINFIFKIYTKI